MLLELRVENLVLIERAELRLGAGLNVITGETGAGKTMLASALDLLLGGRSRSSLVRQGAAEAYVEGVFDLTPALRERLGDRIPVDAEDLVLARRVTAEGRTRAYIAGRSATAGELREVAEVLIAFTGQHEHRRLVEPAAQLELVDGAAGSAQVERLIAMRGAHDAVRDAERRLRELDERAAERERQLDVARYELDEIERIAPQPGEAEELALQRDRLRHLDRLVRAAGAAAESIDVDDADVRGISSLAGVGLHELEAAEGVDERLDPLIERYRAASIELADLATDLRGYLADLDGEPGNLEAVESRLAELERILRKYGGSTEEALAHAERCRALLDELGDVEGARQRLVEAVAGAREHRDDVAAKLTKARRAAAKTLAGEVRTRLRRLAMEAADFRIDVSGVAPGPSGADTVEFVLQANPGAPAAPLREVASGGELSRVLLALVGAAGGGADTTYVLDEIDAGIGGRTAAALGAELQHLASGRQVLCITHLPQIAALADRHSTIVKAVGRGTTTTTITPLSGEAVTAELVRMLGADEGDVAALQHAEALRMARDSEPVVAGSGT
ncbi:MAG: DNA repair protein RecN [Solirubrobacteraceae bacterium]|nr:DNA repair protein RecN [Solirubrobacteraceae bacterium]